jgi:hypothetical protein
MIVGEKYSHKHRTEPPGSRHRHQVALREQRQHPGVDLVGLARQRREALDLRGVGDQHIPAELLKLIVHKPRARHRLDHAPHGFLARSDAARQAPQPVAIGRRGELLDDLGVLRQQAAWMRWPWPTSQQALEMPVEELAMAILGRLAATEWGDGRPNRAAQIVSWIKAWNASDGLPALSGAETIRAYPALVEAAGEAWDWLRFEGLLAGAVFVTGGRLMLAR